MFELAWPPAVHTRRRVFFGTGGLLHELCGVRGASRGSWFGSEMVLVVLQECLETRWVVSVTVIDRLPRFPEKTVCFVDVGGVSIVGCVVIDRRVRTVVVFDVPVVVLYGTLLGVVFAFLFGVLFVFGLYLCAVVVKVVKIRHISGFDVVVISDLPDFSVHMSGGFVMS